MLLQQAHRCKNHMEGQLKIPKNDSRLAREKLGKVQTGLIKNKTER